MIHDKILLTYGLTDKCVRVRYQPKLTAQSAAEIAVVERCEAADQAGIEVKLWLIDQQD